jgi:hypothetical protein
MSLIEVLKKVVVGAPLGVAAVAALPIFGAVGTVTALDAAVGATVGALAGVMDAVKNEKETQRRD